jgi:phosphate/sulfate permease
MNLGLFWAAAFWLVTAIVHIAFAFAVLADSHLLWRHLRRKTFLVGGGMWALATLLGGVFTAAIYWLIHHSTLRPQQPPVAATAPPISEPESPH